MEYLYEQQPIPTNATGVTVTLDAVDPNNNFVHIGTATSDISGTFHYVWSPTIEGEYTIIATFAGSKSYGASYAETAIGVTPAPPVTNTNSPNSSTRQHANIRRHHSSRCDNNRSRHRHHTDTQKATIENNENKQLQNPSFSIFQNSAIR